MATVFTDDKRFVSAEIARRGLGMAVKFGDNDAYFKTVQAAQGQAKKKLRGLYSKTIECAIPAQVEALKGQMADVQGADSATAPSADVSALVARSAAIIAGITELERLLDLDEPPISVAILLKTPKLKHSTFLRSFNKSAVLLRKKLISVETAALAREAAAARKAAADAAAAAQAAADAKAAADAQAADDARAAEKERAASVPTPLDRPSPLSPDTYTGCRAYGSSGTSVDDQGRRYTKIPC